MSEEDQGEEREASGPGPYNMIETLTNSILEFQAQIEKATLNSEDATKRSFEGLLLRSIEEFYSFMDAQEAMDKLTKLRATGVYEYESTMMGPTVKFESEFDFGKVDTGEDNVVRGLFGESEDDEDPDPTVN